MTARHAKALKPLAIVTPRDAVFAQAIRLWAAEHGIPLVESVRKGKPSPNLHRLAEPYICRNGHSCDTVYLRKDKNGRVSRLCPTCRDATEARHKANLRQPKPLVGRPRVPPFHPYMCRHGHLVKGDLDEFFYQTKQRSYIYCLLCWRRRQAGYKRRRAEKKNAGT